MSLTFHRDETMGNHQIPVSYTHLDVYKRQGYQFVNLGKMTDFIKKGDDPTTAWEKSKGQYGRVDDAVKIIDPRKE